MAEILGKVVEREVYDALRPDRLFEGQLAVDGLYGVMLALEVDRPVSILLPALVTGRGPLQRGQLLYTSMLNRQQQRTAVHVEIQNGIFSHFNSNILVPAGAPQPEIVEGFYIDHPEVAERASALHARIQPKLDADYAAHAR